MTLTNTCLLMIEIIEAGDLAQRALVDRDLEAGEAEKAAVMVAKLAPVPSNPAAVLRAGGSAVDQVGEIGVVLGQIAMLM